MLKEAPEDTAIYTRFPLPVTNALAAEVVRKLNAKAFEAEPELDEEALEELLKNSTLPHFEVDGELPLLVSRAEINTQKRHDGSGNTLTIKKDAAEGTWKLFIADCNVRKKFRKGKLL